MRVEWGEVVTGLSPRVEDKRQEELLKRLESDINFPSNMPSSVCIASIAISLKRIADCLGRKY
jgi:hypothetical protein